MSSISGQIIGDTFHMKNKDVRITGRITNDDIMIGLIKLNENISSSSTPPQESSTDSETTGAGIELTGIDFESLPDYYYYFDTTYITDYVGTCINGLIHNDETYLKYPFEPA